MWRTCNSGLVVNYSHIYCTSAHQPVGGAPFALKEALHTADTLCRHHDAQSLSLALLWGVTFLFIPAGVSSDESFVCRTHAYFPGFKFSQIRQIALSSHGLLWHFGDATFVHISIYRQILHKRFQHFYPRFTTLNHVWLWQTFTKSFFHVKVKRKSYKFIKKRIIYASWEYCSKKVTA